MIVGRPLSPAPQERVAIKTEGESVVTAHTRVTHHDAHPVTARLQRLGDLGLQAPPRVVVLRDRDAGPGGIARVVERDFGIGIAGRIGAGRREREGGDDGRAVPDAAGRHDKRVPVNVEGRRQTGHIALHGRRLSESVGEVAVVVRLGLRRIALCMMRVALHLGVEPPERVQHGGRPAGPSRVHRREWRLRQEVVVLLEVGHPARRVVGPGGLVDRVVRNLALAGRARGIWPAHLGIRAGAVALRVRAIRARDADRLAQTRQ